MFSQFNKYLMLKVLSLYGFLIWSWWVWFWTCGLIHPEFSALFIPIIMGEQYLIAVLISILLLIEIIIRKHNKKLDAKLNIKLPERVFNIGLILLFLPLFLVGMFLFLIPLW